MSAMRVGRRAFLAAAAGAAAAAVPTRARAADASQAPARPLRLGGPIFETSDDPEVLARAHRAKGYRARTARSSPWPTRTDQGHGASLRAQRRGDRGGGPLGQPARRRSGQAPQNLATVTEGLALADAIGARCCVDIAGSFSTTSWFGPHPDNLAPRFFDAAVENARKIIDAVKPTRTVFTYEMMAWSLPDSPDACLRMIEAVDRKAFAVHLDPCNLINSPERNYRSSDVIRECYAKLGPRIASVHAKDLAWDVEYAVHFREVRIGLGTIDYGVFLAEHAKHAPDVPLMLEHLPNESEYDAARAQVIASGERIGLRFE
jgi:sugar phosphate isomerase/epimerase